MFTRICAAIVALLMPGCLCGCTFSIHYHKHDHTSEEIFNSDKQADINGDKVLDGAVPEWVPDIPSDSR